MTLPVALSWRSRPEWTRSHLWAASNTRTACGTRATRLELDQDKPQCRECRRIGEKETT